MQIIYEGKNITDYANVRSCVFFDYAGEKLDTLVIEFENSKAWNRWKPQTDDRIEVREGKYTTGKLYLSSHAPEDDRYKIIATSAPIAAKRRGWQNFEIKTINEIFNVCSVACGMDYSFFGIGQNNSIPYIERENETYLAFLQRLMTLEGGTLKCVNGKMTGISYLYAQDLPCKQTVEILSTGQGAQYYNRPDKAFRSLTIKTLFANAEASDSALSRGESAVYTFLPAMSNVQAGRWARGTLLSNNRKAETVTLDTEFNQGITALARIDITGDTAATGEWLCECAKHDFINKKTSAELHRCIRTVS